MFCKLAQSLKIDNNKRLGIVDLPEARSGAKEGKGR
jgi:hypothetical protein